MPKIAVICNTMDNYYRAKMGLGVTLSNAGMEFDLFINDNGSTDERVIELIESYNPKYFNKSKENLGNPVSYNQMLLRVEEMGYEYIAMIAPDIVLPNHWLKLWYDVYKLCNLEGLVGYNWGLPQHKQFKKFDSDKGAIYLEHCNQVFGCWFFSTKMLDKVGYINPAYKMYGKWDSDWNFRLNAMGIDSYYLPVRCVHLTSPLDQGTKYREFKNKWLAHNEEVYKSEMLRYAREGNYYIDKPEKIGA